ncbi:hypothetical protein [uncultured Maritimibacter sp.]|jgi:hypothetical protein|uniref:hypothetical protein n=1 Tax=uncultured Maritimibacter sp. TaxID=991866 RepID=UPI00261C152E|nr:hypothetical protein [uncultured Maritimibacter sp.]
MPGSYRILPRQGIVYVEYHGNASIDDARALLDHYVADPDRRPGQRQLIDLSRVTSWERDFVGLMKYQAESIARIFAPQGTMMMVLYASTPPGVELAQTFVRAWSDIQGVVVTLQTTESEALSVLGQPETRIIDLLEAPLAAPRTV